MVSGEERECGRMVREGREDGEVRKGRGDGEVREGRREGGRRWRSEWPERWRSEKLMGIDEGSGTET